MASSSYSVLIQLSRFLLKYKGTLIAAGCALVFTAGVTLAMGQGIKILIDEGFVGLRFFDGIEINAAFGAVARTINQLRLIR